MELFGVCNASPDSLNTDSIVITPEQAVARVTQLLADGAQHVDLGGQGSTFQATQVDTETEWARIVDIVPAIAALGVTVAVDTWNPEVMRRSIECGATVMNAADGMQLDAMWTLAAESGCPVVLPFMLGPDPLHLEHVTGDALEVMVDWFGQKLAVADRFGVRRNIILDPGTGFAPLGWEWESRYHYQRYIYSNLDRLRAFDLPLYIALPWRETAQHDELLEIVLRYGVEYGRAHYPARVRTVEAAVI
jgi:dihydropteroate synthase